MATIKKDSEMFLLILNSNAKMFDETIINEVEI